MNIVSDNVWGYQDERGINRGCKPVGALTNGFGGGFPVHYVSWLKKRGWLQGEKICWLCSGGVTEPGFKVDVRESTKPDLVADATATGLPDDQFDVVLIDPPYSAALAKELYGTDAVYHSINKFLKEGIRLAKPGGRIISLSYEVCGLFKDAELEAVWGIYTVPSTSSMRVHVVFKKK